MNSELRRDIRHLSSHKVVLINKYDVGSFGVITNLSSGGLCIAMIGSPNPVGEERIDMKVNSNLLFCNVVNSGKEGLHCQFDDFIDEMVMSRMFKAAPGARQLSSPLGADPGRPSLHSSYDRPDERRHWALGFTDSVRHLAKYGLRLG